MKTRAHAIGVGRLVALATGIVALPSIALAGPDWVERGDAGSNFSTAQPANQNGQLHTIYGSLGGSSLLGAPDYEDCYIIRISEPTKFDFQVSNVGFQVQLWLFNITYAGQTYGLLGNELGDSPNSARLTSAATDGTGVIIDAPGDYMLAITGAGDVPLSRTGEIFNFQDPHEISGADGPGGLNPLSGWSGPGETGGYTVELSGAEGPHIPTPGTTSMFIIGVSAIVPRRRRR